MKNRRELFARNLRAATEEDIKNDANKEFYYMQGTDYIRIQRLYPDDYNNFKWFKDKKKIADEFIQSCREDWTEKTSWMYGLMFEDNLYIIKKEDESIQK